MAYADGLSSCPCGRRWSSLRECHCTMCHLQFANEESFDFHITRNRTAVRCLTQKEIASGSAKTHRKPMYRLENTFGAFYSRRRRESPTVGGAGVCEVWAEPA